MAINLAGQAIKDVRVAGVQAQRVMLGTGSTAVEVWSASHYPLTGTWESAITGTTTTYAVHTIADDGSYTLTHTVTGGGQYTFASISGPWGITNGTVGPPSTATTTQTLAAGDLIKFEAGSLAPSGTASGSWSIVKN